MTAVTKQRIAIAVIVVSVIGTLQGREVMIGAALAEQSTAKGALITFGSVAIGLAASVCAIYFRAERAQEVAQASKIEVETLNAMSAQAKSDAEAASKLATKDGPDKNQHS